jgi:tetratricopeptide (TPR) repeat protein/SAM-dependent methyltransferase
LLVKTNFFVSYNHKDTTWAEWIAWQLEDGGYSTVIQAWDFGAGQNFVLAMQKAAAESERTIAVLSADYLKSHFTAPEWAAAFARDPTGEKGILVPVRVRECNPEGLLPQIVYIDLVGVENPAEAADRLLKKIKPGRRKPEVEPPFPGGSPTTSDAPPFPGSAAPSWKRRRAPLPQSDSYLFINVPPMPTHFVGREELLAEMIRKLTSGENAALSASGKGGVGKTTLAVAIAQSPEIVEHFADGVLWAGLGPKPDVMSTLANWGDVLGVDVTGYALAEQRARSIRNTISLRRMLLVIDDAWQSEPALLLRCGGPNCCHLLTTRDDAIARTFAGVTGTERVLELADAPAFELLRQIAPEACEVDPEAARQLAVDTGGLPLALELLGGYLAIPEHSFFPDLSATAFLELSNPKRRLELAHRRLGSLDDHSVTLQDTISLSLEGLNERSRSAFFSLGAFAPKPAAFDRAAAEAVTNADVSTLALLIARNLVDQVGNRLAVHQAIADVAREGTPNAAQERHRSYYLNCVKAARQEWRQVEEIYGQVKQACDTLPDDERLLLVINVLKRYLTLRRLWKDALHLMTRGLGVAEQTSDKAAVGALLADIGEIHYRLGHRVHALDYFERALQISRDLGDRVGEAATLNNIGAVHITLGDRRKALEFFEQALPIRQEVGDRAGEATALNSIGWAQSRLGDRKRALEFYERALQIRQEVGDRAEEAATLNNIGAAYNNLGDRRKALEFYERALPIRQEVGDRAGEATTLNSMGLVYSRLGDRAKALELYERALRIRLEIGDRAEQATTLNNIGAVYNSLGDRRKALDFYERALPIRQEVGDRGGEAITLNSIGLAHSRLGDHEKALEFYERSLQIHQDVGDRSGEAATTNNIGAILEKFGEHDRALKNHERALSIWREVGGRAGEGSSLNYIGLVYSYKGEYTRALGYLEKALSIRQEIADPAGQASTLTNIGRVYRNLNEYSTAIHYLDTALPLRLQVGDKTGEAETRRELAVTYHASGNTSQAVRELRIAVTLEETVQHPEHAEHRALLLEMEAYLAENGGEWPA